MLARENYMSYTSATDLPKTKMKVHMLDIFPRKKSK